MSEGKTVAVAFNGPVLNEDEFIDFIEARNREDANRASTAGESRQEIGAFIEETGMNGKALSWCRQIMKVNGKADGQHKAMDIIMSLKSGLAIVEAFVRGQGTQDMDFGPDEDDIDLTGDGPSGGDGLADDPRFVHDAFARGREAYQNGVALNGNPFAADSVRAGMWAKGWENALADDAAGGDEIDDEEIEAIGNAMDGDLEAVENVVTPHFGGAA